MEALTKGDMKQIMDEFRKEMREFKDDFRKEMREFRDEARSEMRELRDEIKQSIREGFHTWKPAAEAQDSGLQVAADLLQRQDHRGVEEASAADPVDPSALFLVAPGTGDEITTELQASLGTSNFNPAPDCAAVLSTAADTLIISASPAVAEDVLEVDIDTITTAPASCSTECQSCDAIELTSVFAPATATTSSMASVAIIPLLTAAAASEGAFNDEAIKSTASMALSPITESSLAVTRIIPNDTITVVYTMCPADCATQVITTPLPTPATTMPTLLWTFPSEGITNFRCNGRLQRPMPWPSFQAGQLTVTAKRPRPWPSFTSYRGCACQKQCHGVLLHTAVQVAPNRLKEMLVCDVYAVEQSESQQTHKSYSEPSIKFSYAGSSAPCVSDCEQLLVCTPNIYVCWESDFVPHEVQHVEQIKVLQPWDSGLQADFLYVQFTCLDQHTSCFPGNFITGGQIQDFVACSTLHMFLSGFLVSFRSVVMLDLQMARGGCPGVYLHKLQMDTSLMEGASLNNIHISVNLSHSVDMAVYCSSFSCTTGGAICKHIMASTTFRNVGTLCWPGNFYSKATYDTYLKKPMHENLNISESNGSVSLGVLVHCSIGAAYLCWISDQENKISYVVVVLPDGQRSRNWHSTQTTNGQDAPLFTIPSVVLIYMVYCWVPAAILTDIVSIFSMHSQRLFFGVMNMSFAGNKLTCFSNSETGSCLFYVRLEISSELLSASSEWMWFSVGFGFLLIWALAESAYGLPLEVAYSECPNLNLALASDGMGWQIAWSGMSGGSSRGNIKIGGNDTLFIRFRRGTSFFGLLLSAHNLFPDETFEADRVFLGLRTASFSRREVFMRAGFSEQVHLSCKYYLNHAYQVDKGCSNFMYCHDDSNKTKEVHMPWDPGKSNFKHTTPKASAWGQAEFQGGRDVSTLSYQDRYVGHYMGLAHLQELQTTNTQERGTIGSSGWITNQTAAAANYLPTYYQILPHGSSASTSCL